MTDSTRSAAAIRLALSGLGMFALVGCGIVQPVNSQLMSSDLRPSTVIVSDEIQRANVSSAYDAVERLRPTFLHSTRGAAGYGERRVYIDGVYVGGLSQLRLIPAMTVREVQYLSGVEATTRFGTGNSGGALLITTGSDLP